MISYRLPLRLLVIAAPLNFVWEMLQAPAFTGMPDDWLAMTGWCALATVGDVILVIMLWALGLLIFKSGAWFTPPRAMRYVMIIAVGVAVQVLVEWVMVNALGSWGYSPKQPVIFGVGLLVVLQPVVLLPMTFAILALWGGRSAGSRRQ